MTNKPNSAELPDLDPRARQVLGAVIREYIATAEPVASVQLVRGYKLDVSPATVRNELAALEAAGLQVVKLDEALGGLGLLAVAERR